MTRHMSSNKRSVSLTISFIS